MIEVEWFISTILTYSGLPNLIDLINKYGTERIISAELAFDPFWFNEPKNPGWRFFRVMLQSWNRPDAEEMTEIFKVLLEK